EVLILTNVEYKTVIELINKNKLKIQSKNIKETREMTEVISEKLVEIYYGDDDEDVEKINYQTDDLTVILVVGVNGVGKTTSIGKLAHQLKSENKHVVLAAGDRSEEHTSEL